MRKKILTEREWITIHGRKLLWNELIRVFDDWRYDRTLDHLRQDTRYKALEMGDGIQCLTNDYVYGLDSITEHNSPLSDYQLQPPSTMQLPEALGELTEQIECSLHIDLSPLLDKAVKRSQERFEKLQSERKKEAKRIAFVSELRQSINEEHLDRIPDRIAWILALQGAKKEHGYTVSEEQMSKELYASELWCSILIHSLNSLFITHGQMKRLVENEILDEYDMSALLKEKAKNRRIMNGTARISWVMTLMRIQYCESWMCWKKLNQS